MENFKAFIILSLFSFLFFFRKQKVYKAFNRLVQKNNSSCTVDLSMNQFIEVAEEEFGKVFFNQNNVVVKYQK